MFVCMFTGRGRRGANGRLRRGREGTRTGQDTGTGPDYQRPQATDQVS